ncbi:MAG: LysR family transcriptional regulator [Nevskia sp.]|nr:LysR family transcriptional regulator [Nevskia sp.]
MNKTRRHLSLDQLESFVALADSGGVTAAARSLGRAQPTISQHLQRLEAQLERPLFVRDRNGTTLTAEGRRLLPLARGLLRLHGQLAAAEHGLPLRLGACSNIGIYLLPELLIELRRRGQALPEIAIAGNPQIARGLTAGELDVALLEWWGHQPGYEAHIWRHEPIVAILPSNHALSVHETVNLAQLRRYPVLGGEAGTGTGRLLNTHLRGRRPLTVAMSLGSTEAVKRAVSAGLGVSLVLRLSVVDALAGDKPPLAVKPLAPPLSKPLYLVWRHGVSPRHPLLAGLLEAGEH